MNIEKKQIDELDTLWHVILHAILRQKPIYSDERLRDITTFDLTLISDVARKPDIILKDIRETTNLANSTLTSVIDRLERRGLLQRVISSRDRRSYGLQLTDKGQDVYQAHVEYEQRLFAQMLGQLDSSEERATLLALLRKILSGMGLLPVSDQTT